MSIRKAPDLVDVVTDHLGLFDAEAEDVVLTIPARTHPDFQDRVPFEKAFSHHMGPRFVIHH